MKKFLLHEGDCGCGCGCHDEHGEHEEEVVDYMDITLDDGTELQCEVLGIFDFEGKSYIALCPVEGEEEEILIYEYNEINDEEVELNVIEDEDLYDRVVEELESYFEEEDEEE